MKTLLFIFILLIPFNCYSNEIEILLDIPGEGKEIKNHFKVHVNYRGTLENGEEFDNSFKRKKPFVFQIGLRQVILGWEKGLIGMKVGGKRTIRIPPELAYGSQGAGDLIPPYATLIFELEIVDAFKPNYIVINSEDLIKKKHKLIIIDIRTKEEKSKNGIIKDSLEIVAFNPNGNLYPNFIKNYKKNASKNDHVVFVSNHGEISTILANGFVEQLGYQNIYTLEGGIQKWIKDGNEVFN